MRTVECEGVCIRRHGSTLNGITIVDYSHKTHDNVEAELSASHNTDITKLLDELVIIVNNGAVGGPVGYTQFLAIISQLRNI